MALFKILEPIILVYFAPIHSLHRRPALWGSHLRVGDSSHIKSSTHCWGHLRLRLLGLMATEVLRLHLGLVISGQVFWILHLPTDTATTKWPGASTATASSCRAWAELLHATINLQLLALRLLSRNVWDHRVLVSWAARPRVSTYWTLLLLLLLQGKVISTLAIAHLLLQEPLQNRVPTTTAVASRSVLGNGGCCPHFQILRPTHLMEGGASGTVHTPCVMNNQ